MTEWYYADRGGQQQGPVDASWLAGAVQRGEIATTSLVWRDGLRDWVPLAQVANELGIVIASPAAAPPPPMPPAAPGQRPVVVAKSSGTSTWLIVGIVLIFGFLVFGGILAAIAIPAYQDYTIRAKVAQGANEGRALRLAVIDFHEREQRCPGNADEGFKPAQDYATPFVESIEIGELEDGRCAIYVAFRDLGSGDLEDASLTFAMDGAGEWSHETTLPDRYLPSSMR